MEILSLHRGNINIDVWIGDNLPLSSSKQSSTATRHGGAWWERSYSSYSFTTSALDGVSGQRHAPSGLYSRGKDPGIPCAGRWVDLRAGLDTEATGKNPLTLPRIEPRSSGRPVRSQTLYWLSYPGSYIMHVLFTCNLFIDAYQISRKSTDRFENY
jgi:hypothetical protein